MSTVQERIIVILQAVTKDFKNKIDQAGQSMERLKKNMTGFNTVMQEPMERFKKLKGRMKGMNTAGGKFAYNIRRWTHGMRGFRMEMLGVMFAGMALQRVFSSLLQPAAEAFGIFDMWKEMLLIMFIPVIEAILPMFMAFTEFFINMPEPLQKAIGFLVLIGLAFGVLLGVVGAFALGAGSFILAILGPTALLFAGIAAVVAGVIFIVTGFADLFKGKFEGIGKIIMGIGLILLLFIGWWALIPIAVGAAVWAIIKYWEPIKEFFSKLWEGIKTAFSNAIQWIKDKFKALIPFLWGLLPDWLKNAIYGAGKFAVAIQGASGLGEKNKNDFIWRAGQGVTNIAPNDTVVGVKDTNKLGSLGGGGASFNPTYNINVIDKSWIMQIIEENNRKVLAEIRRNGV